MATLGVKGLTIADCRSGIAPTPILLVIRDSFARHEIASDRLSQIITPFPRANIKAKHF